MDERREGYCLLGWADHPSLGCLRLSWFCHESSHPGSAIGPEPVSPAPRPQHVMRLASTMDKMLMFLQICRLR